MKFADFIISGEGNIICTAIHNGHQLSEAIGQNMNLSEAERLYEEDPYTSFFTEKCPNRVIANYSRFEIDLNRPPERAYYQKPEDAWGLTVRKEENERNKNFALKEYYQFYEKMAKVIEELLLTHKRLFIYDLHSYNHQRLGRGMTFDDPMLNPEIILGTNNMPDKWKALIGKIRNQLVNDNYCGRSIDARINVKFPGGYFTRWLHHKFPGKVICLALEFKKIFMDEWTGEVNWHKAEKLRDLLNNTFPVIENWLEETP